MSTGGEAPFPDHFSSAAASYARYRPGYPPALADHLAALAPRRDLAWDVGCGSGQLSRLLAPRFGRVIATDASPEQVARAEEIAGTAPHPNLEYRVARAEASGLPSGAADLVTAAQAAHWFDIEAFHAEVRRVARAGGVIALVSYGLFRSSPAVDAVVRRFYSEVLGRHWPPQRRHVEEGYRSLPFPYEELDAPALEHRAVWRFEEVWGYIGTWSAVRALLREEGRAAEGAGPMSGEEHLVRFRRELAAAWGAGPEPREIRWPLAIRIGRV